LTPALLSKSALIGFGCKSDSTTDNQKVTQSHFYIGSCFTNSLKQTHSL
jgi:hypothetical protein